MNALVELHRQEVPELDVWAYAITSELMQELKA